MGFMYPNNDSLSWVTQNWLQAHSGDLCLRDMNPIDNLWNMKESSIHLQLSSTYEYKEAVGICLGDMYLFGILP